MSHVNYDGIPSSLSSLRMYGLNLKFNDNYMTIFIVTHWRELKRCYNNMRYRRMLRERSRNVLSYRGMGSLSLAGLASGLTTRRIPHLATKLSISALHKCNAMLYIHVLLLGNRRTDVLNSSACLLTRRLSRRRIQLNGGAN